MLDKHETLQQRQESQEQQRRLKEEQDLKTYKNAFKSADMMDNKQLADKFTDSTTGQVDIVAFEDDFMWMSNWIWFRESLSGRTDMFHLL